MTSNLISFLSLPGALENQLLVEIFLFLQVFKAQDGHILACFRRALLALINSESEDPSDSPDFPPDSLSYSQGLLKVPGWE